MGWVGAFTKRCSSRWMLWCVTLRLPASKGECLLQCPHVLPNSVRLSHLLATLPPQDAMLSVFWGSLFQGAGCQFSSVIRFSSSLFFFRVFYSSCCFLGFSPCQASLGANVVVVVIGATLCPGDILGLVFVFQIQREPCSWSCFGQCSP